MNETGLNIYDALDLLERRIHPLIISPSTYFDFCEILPDTIIVDTQSITLEQIVTIDFTYRKRGFFHKLLTNFSFYSDYIYRQTQEYYYQNLKFNG